MRDPLNAFVWGMIAGVLASTLIVIVVLGNVTKQAEFLGRLQFNIDCAHKAKPPTTPAKSPK